MTASPPADDLEIDPREVDRRRRDQPGEMLLLDCRRPEEYELACIEGAMLLPMQELSERMAELDAWRHRPIVVHCHAGVRSLTVTQWLREAGFADVRSMAGGIHRWSLEVDRDVPTY